ncbi:MAG TPA: T9SS type A sorting domain-containing protein [Bacteroidetes bacterium]|nr:T9SS type A sorting domain-containing protein [Bacteroidota bacterium]
MGFIRIIFITLLPVLLVVEEAIAQPAYERGKAKENSSSLRIILDNDEGLVLSYNAGNGEFEKLKPDEGSFLRLRLADHSFSAEPGKPQLPVLTRLVDYDRLKGARIIIRDVVSIRKSLKEFGEYGIIYPSQPGLAKGANPQDKPFVIDKSVYNAGHAYVKDTVIIRKIGVMRGKSLASLEINPVIYNPADKYIDIISSMNIYIEYSPVTDTRKTAKSSDDYYFNGLLSMGLINYDVDDVIPGFSMEPVGMVIISDTSFKKHLKPLVEWKTKKGFRVSQVYIGENGLERNFRDIKDSLTYIYNNSSQENPPPTYLLLAGDLNYIPASEGTNYLTDMYYAEFDGNGDFIPDMFTGRLPAGDTAQMKSMVNKIIQYESFSFVDTVTHYQKAMAFAGFDEGFDTFMDGQVNYASEYFDQNPFPTRAYVFNHELNDSIRKVRYDSLKILIKNGLGYINYTGHGSTTSWTGTGIDNTFPSKMQNYSRYPLVISNACLTAKYNDNNCLGSSMVRAIDKGALAFIGCTNDSYWEEDYYWSVGAGPIVRHPSYEETGLAFYDRLFHLNGEAPSDWYTTTGQILFGGNLGVTASPSPRKQYYWETYVLLGDPSISPYIGKPEILSTSVPDKLPPTLKKLNVNTSAFAYLGLSHFDTLWDATHASPSGNACLDLPETEKDSCLLIISSQNKKPFVKTIYFEESDTAWLGINDVNVSDLSGNDNGKADYKENISLKTGIQNAGNAGAADVYLKISSSSEYLSIITDSLYIGTVEANSEIIETGFDITVSDSLPDLDIATLNLELHYNGNILRRTADFSLHAPELIILNCLTDDTYTGNGNGLPEAGERIKIIFKVSNNGSSSCSGSLYLTGISEYINFDATELASGLINPGEVTDIPVFAEINENTPESTEISFDAELICSPYKTLKTLSIISGKYTEDFELLNFNTFPWQNDSEAPWIITGETSISNMFSARSGHITHNEKSVLGILLNLPEDDTLKFWYKVSSEENWDSLTFKVNNKILISASGEVDWTEAVIPLGRGVYKLEWIYGKDQSVNNGSDCAYIDLVRFPPLSFVQSAIHLNEIISPREGTNYSDEVISLELSNLGRDTIYSLSMSYIVNNNQPVSETFNTELKPGDTLTLSFSQTFDMSADNTYEIEVFVTSPDNYFINDTLRLTIISTGIDDINPGNEYFTVAPNPVRDKIRIISHTNSEGNAIMLYNTSGVLIYRKEIEFISADEQIYIDHAKLLRGNYILVIRNNTKSFTYKIIKL